MVCIFWSAWNAEATKKLDKITQFILGSKWHNQATLNALSIDNNANDVNEVLKNNMRLRFLNHYHVNNNDCRAIFNYEFD